MHTDTVIPSSTPAWKVWKIIRLGIGPRDATEFRAALSNSHMPIRGCADDILGNREFTVAKKPVEVNLVLLGLEDLGLKEEVMLADVYEAARTFGLELCPAEVGPQLRLQYKNQEAGQVGIIIGMEPLIDSRGKRQLFCVTWDDDERCIMADWADRALYAEDRFAFMLPINPESIVWKTIKLGTGIKDATGFRQAMARGKMLIGDWADDILGNKDFTVAQEAAEVDVIAVSVSELGFGKGAKLSDIYGAAQKCGLALCPAEVGPQLRLQYCDQPLANMLVIGMEPITHLSGYLHLFALMHDGYGQWLGSYSVLSGRLWNPDRKFVFVLPRK